MLMLYDAFPGLQRLHLVDPRDSTIPPLPNTRALERLTLTYTADMINPSYTILLLEALGYSQVPFISLTAPNLLPLLVASTHACHFPESTLTVGASKVQLRRSSHVFEVETASGIQPGAWQQSCHNGAFQHIRRLVLPLYHGHEFDSLAPACPFFPGDATLRCLETLAIHCGRPVPDCPSLLDRGVQRGVVTAPQLARVELLRDPAYFGILAPIEVEGLAALLREHVSLDRRASLAVFVDGANGVKLQGDEDAVESLRAVVGTLVAV
ncbi:hypothetical protein AURDEDRAFT_161762 [Auricularia subglabra TFB-10046 SS5]|nr:hypothetical protein AURDEDRAFT_161762 [Auricularia subglabra TFB-10046 SS5]